MPNWVTFADDIQSINTDTLPLPNASSKKILDELILFEKITFNRLEKLLRLSLTDDEKEKRVRHFFAMRWSLIADSSLDYTLNPLLPTNKICAAIATCIRKNGEAVCQILMPSVKKIIGTGLAHENDLTLASENAEGEFILQNHLIDFNGCALIALPDLLDRAQHNTDILFSTSTSTTHINRENDTSKTIYSFTAELTADARHRVRTLCGESSERYFVALEKIHRVSHGQKPSIGHLLEKLIAALLKSSTASSGSEIGADFLECYKPIVEFYDCWSKLSPDVKNKIKYYRPNHNRHPEDCLESQLLCLFFNSGISLSKAESDRVRSEDVLECTHQIGNLLDSLLKSHRDLFNIPLPGRELEFEYEALPTQDELTQLLSNFKTALENRSPLSGERDDVILDANVFFEMLTAHCFDLVYSHEQLTELTHYVTTLNDFIIVLRLLPTHHWRDWVTTNCNWMKALLASDDKSWDALSYILNQLPEENWKIFCDALCELPELKKIVKASDLGYLLLGFQETQLDALAAATQTLAKQVFIQPRDIGIFFSTNQSANWKLQYNMFQSIIDSLIDHPGALGEVFRQVDSEHWHSLVNIFKSVLVTQLSQCNFFEATFVNFNHFFKINFIETILPLLDEAGIQPALVIRMMMCLTVSHWEKLFSLLGNVRASQFLKNESDLTYFLDHIRFESHRIVFINALHCFDALFEINIKSFYALLQKFPHCKDHLLILFSRRLPAILLNFSATFTMSVEYHQTLSAEFLTQFDFFLTHALPILLSFDVIKKMIPRFSELGNVNFTDCPDVMALFFSNFCDIEDKIKKNEVTILEACYQKLALFDCLLKQKPILKDRNAKIIFQHFCEALEIVFGKRFFSELIKYKHKNLKEWALEPPSSKTIGTQTTESQRQIQRRMPPTLFSNVSPMPRRIPPPPPTSQAVRSRRNI